MNDIRRYLPEVAEAIDVGIPMPRLEDIIEESQLRDIVSHECTRRGVPVGWCYCPPGIFTMGSPDGEEGRWRDETQHEVAITRGFFAKATPVTQGEWKLLMGNNPSCFTKAGDNAPVECVSWYDAVAYCNALSRSYGVPECYDIRDVKGNPGTGGYGFSTDISFSLDAPGFRLPTEAEWEYAARADSTGARYGDLDAISWYYKNSGGTTHPVGMKKPNAWGLYDMLGNVWEWCWDKYGEYPTPPVESTGVGYGLNRGGSCNSFVDNIRAAKRNWTLSKFFYGGQGFRPVVTNRYGEYPASSTLLTDPTGKTNGRDRVNRGGGLYSDASFLF